MKKLFAAVLCIGLLSSSLSAINLLRTWQCRPTNPQPNCSQRDKNDANDVFKTTSLEKLAELLAESGITATAYQLQKEREAAIRSTQSITDERTRQFKQTQQVLEASERQRRQTMEQITR